jgi:hypothetical protein
MNIRFSQLLGILSLLSLFSTAHAGTVDSIDSYGIYVVSTKGYVKVQPFNHDYKFVDFNYTNEIPFVMRGSDSLKLIVFEKDFQPNSVELEIRPLDTRLNIKKIGFSAKPLDKADFYELSADMPVSDGAMLHVRSWSNFDNMGVIMLGDTEKEMVKFFSNKDLENASIVNQYLDDTLRAFPDNAELKALSLYWNSKAESEKDLEAYGYVEEKWQQYENAEKLSLKERYLNAVIIEINGYLNEHPNGAKAAEAKARKSLAEEQLKQYEKLL